MGKLGKSIVLGLLLLISACGVRVEIAEPIAASPTAQPWRGLSKRFNSFDRLQAAPRLAFLEDGSIQADLFMATDQQPMLMLQYRQMWLYANYTATWFGNADNPLAGQSNARLRMRLYTRADASAKWETYNTTEVDLTTGSTPASQNDQLGISYYVEGTGRMLLRAEFELVLYPSKGELVNKVAANEFAVVVMPDVDDQPISTERGQAASPQVGELTSERLLFDWRAWSDTGGACALAEQAPRPALSERLTRACEALGTGDLSAAVDMLTLAWNEVGENDDWRFALLLENALGLLAAQTDKYALAANVFASAVRHAPDTGEGFFLSISLTNLLSAHAALDDLDSAYQVLRQIEELNAQFYDEIGRKIVSANIGRKAEELWRVEDAHWFFNGNDMPQRNVTEVWMGILRGGE
jgi:tetratricopeptide (TPR) repeat protein